MTGTNTTATPDERVESRTPTSAATPPSSDRADIARLLDDMRERQRESGEGIARVLAGPLNDYVGRLPRRSIEEKRDVCRWLNAELDALHLGVVCPKTGKVGLLVVNQGDDASRGRFQIRVPERGQRERHVTLSAVELPRLAFGPREVGREVVGEHVGRLLGSR